MASGGRGPVWATGSLPPARCGPASVVIQAVLAGT